MLRRAVGGLMLAAVTLGAGCSTNQAEDGPAPQPLRIIVENDLIPPTTLSIYAESLTGGSTLMGIARPSVTTTLSVDRFNIADYRFVATTTAGNDIISDVITVGGGDTLIWNVRNNVVIRGDP